MTFVLLVIALLTMCSSVSHAELSLVHFLHLLEGDLTSKEGPDLRSISTATCASGFYVDLNSDDIRDDGESCLEQLGEVNQDRFKMVDSHTHSFYDIMEDTLVRDTGADIRDTPFHGGATQTSCADGSDYCPDGWIDGISIIRSVAKTMKFANRSISRIGLKTGSHGGSPFLHRMVAEPSARGAIEVMRVQLQVEDKDITQSVSGGGNWVLRVNTGPSSIDFNYGTLIHLRHEEDIGTLEKVMYLDITKFGAVVKQGIDMSHGQLDVAFNMGENDFVTQCTDIWENAQTSGPADGVADRDGITALCTDVFDRAQTSGGADTVADRDGLTALCADLFDDCINCVQTDGVADTKCDDDGFTAVETDVFNIGTLPQSAGSADGFCDSDGATEVERDTNDTGSLPQSGCDSVVSCGDGLCDSDGATAVADDFERFGDTDFEEVMMGDVLDNADGQHTHGSAGIDANSIAAGDVAASLDTEVACFYIKTPATDEQFESVWRAPVALTITEIWCEVDAGTILLDLNNDDGTPTGINGSDITCPVPDGISDTSFAGDAVFAQGDRVDIDLGTVTTATRVSMCWRYTVN